MKKIETIWHYLLNEALLKQSFRHTQQAVSDHFHYSLSTVHHALQAPLELGAIRKESKFFILEDFKKLLYYWASVRHLERDIVYQTFLDEPIAEVEGLAVPGSIFACYSAARHHLGNRRQIMRRSTGIFRMKKKRWPVNDFQNNPFREERPMSSCFACRLFCRSMAITPHWCKLLSISGTCVIGMRGIFIAL